MSEGLRQTILQAELDDCTRKLASGILSPKFEDELGIAKADLARCKSAASTCAKEDKISCGSQVVNIFSINCGASFFMDRVNFLSSRSRLIWSWSCRHVAANWLRNRRKLKARMS